MYCSVIINFSFGFHKFVYLPDLCLNVKKCIQSEVLDFFCQIVQPNCNTFMELK